MDFEESDIDLNKELKKCKSMDDLLGKNGLIQRLLGECGREDVGTAP